ncbi:MAG: isoleucine--tRNA ligase [Rickettsiales bacterium]
MTTKHYPDIDTNPNFAALEEGILKFWEQDKTFARSVDNRSETKADGTSNAYVFYDGPPFANGLPHYGHLLTGYVKDAIARYHTMKGARVERKFGWDCHGLPAEMGAEKELNITGRAAIIEYGIDKFNDYCRNSVMRHVADWEYYVSRQGRWVDFKNDYKTMDKNFMESVIWAFSELHKKGLVYEAFRVMPYSWAAETPLSNFETRMDNATREREDKAAYVKFRFKEIPEAVRKKYPNASSTNLVAWTTTPWTLPSNLALAVSPQMNYAVIGQGPESVIVAEWAAKKIYGDDLDAHILSGKDLIGLTYEPLFPYFVETKGAFKIIDGGEAVTEGEGTGVIHMAPGFGEIDQKICRDNGIEVIVPVDGQGKFTDEIYDLDDLQLQGLLVVPDTRVTLADIFVSDADKAQHIDAKDIAKYGLANMRIVRWLKAHNKLVKDEPYKHNYPHCWRTDTPIIYRAMSSWYVAVTKFRDRAVEINHQINWIPGHVKNGQMGHMLATAPDWSISRNRFWGTPIPIWRSESGKVMVPSSIAEIEAWSGQKVADLHRPAIDNITFEKDGETYTRVEDVFDCWFESGSMPFAQMHYPFENKQLFEENFPADFITEYVGQTRGWFNTLIMLSTALFDKAPFDNCICHGVVIDEESGLKYSKRLKNYKDPKEVMNAYGADALRWMMLASPVMRGADIGVDPEGKFIRDVVRLNIKPMWSAFNFFTLYANADGVKAKRITTSENVLDCYILAKAKAAVRQVEASMDAYDTPGATDAITAFFDGLNNWYIRRSRPRFWGEQMTADKQAAYDTLFTVLELMCLASAPLLPFVSEAIYRGLNGETTSVHMQDFADVDGINSDLDLVAKMDWVQDICNAASSIRNKKNIRNRQPLATLNLYGNKLMLEFVRGGSHELVKEWNVFHDMIADEVNVKSVVTISDKAKFEATATYKLQINSQILGKRLPAAMKQILPASKKGEWKWRVGGGIEVAGEALQGDEYTINLEPKPEFKDSAAPLSTNDALVVLDLTITPELEAEGRARDLVRMIQQARKDAGLHVADRITLALDVPADFKSALTTHGDYIASQTLAVSWSEGSAKAAQQMKQELDGEQFVIGLSKVA